VRPYHWGYEKHDRAGYGSGNSRNGVTPKRLGTEVGDLDLVTPRDRNGSFEPRLVPKGERRLGGLSDMIISLYAGDRTIRDIQAHLERTLGSELSNETISNITDAVAEEVKDWQSRPLEPPTRSPRSRTSPGRPTTNTGSQSTEQERPAH
jgi:putative transposase